MGEVSEMIEDGILCQDCGAFVGEAKLRSLGVKFEGNKILNSPGYPVTCPDCSPRKKRKSKPTREGGEK